MPNASFHRSVPAESPNREETLAERLAFREDKLRVAIRTHLDHGRKQLVARDAGMRADELSKCLGGEHPRRLPEIVVEASLVHLRGTCGHAALAEAIELLRSGRIENFSDHRCIADVVQFSNGKTRVEFE